MLDGASKETNTATISFCSYETLYPLQRLDSDILATEHIVFLWMWKLAIECVIRWDIS